MDGATGRGFAPTEMSGTRGSLPDRVSLANTSRAWIIGERRMDHAAIHYGEFAEVVTQEKR